MSKQLNIIEAMEMPIGTEFKLKYIGGLERKVAIVEHSEYNNEGIMLQYIDCDKEVYVDVHKSLMSAKFIPIQKPVSFMDAVNSGLENKLIKCDIKNLGLSSEFEIASDKYFKIDEFLVFIGRIFSPSELKDILNNGKFYIKEDK